MWVDLLVDKDKISWILKNEVPYLYQIDLHDVFFHRDGPVNNFTF